MTPAIVYRTAHVFGVAAILVVILWMQTDAKGFDYHTEPKLRFKFHPILMSAGLLFLNGEAVMSFRALKAYPRYLVKALHASLHAASVGVTLVGIKAVRDASQFDSTAINRQSVHAWIGTILSSVYAFLWVASMFLFLLSINSRSCSRNCVALSSTERNFRVLVGGDQRRSRRFGAFEMGK
ncbi:hypothetical protein M3Y94_00874700 [Aphelenchoides besseyi]|nr:hypothetical protein M3Y94_00874700 [Aphelenchoides besseyi]